MPTIDQHRKSQRLEMLYYDRTHNYTKKPQTVLSIHTIVDSEGQFLNPALADGFSQVYAQFPDMETRCEKGRPVTETQERYRLPIQGRGFLPYSTSVQTGEWEVFIDLRYPLEGYWPSQAERIHNRIMEILGDTVQVTADFDELRRYAGTGKSMQCPDRKILD